ncbi:MAG: thymidine phosphorylase, partial [Rhodobacteraceae bacterium]|nr:thymidine phosphorylase [Paracoccaceae bacterium]
QVESDMIDPAVGLSGLVRLGEKVEKGKVLGVIHAGREDAARGAEMAMRRSITVGPGPSPAPDLIYERIG